MAISQFISSIFCRPRILISKRRNDKERLSQRFSSAPPATPSLTVMGMGCAWPPHEIEPKDLEDYAAQLYDLEKAPGIAKMLAINRKTGIKKRPIIWDDNTTIMYQERVPNIKEIDELFRKEAVPLAVQACKKAINEWGGSVSQITHVVAVTATNAGNPGYDQLVSRALGLGLDVDRTLIHGTGCSGGLAALRCASNIASGCSARGVPARILVFATELCSPNVRIDLEHAAETGDIRVGPTLFSDGSSAFMLCNELAGHSAGQGIYSVIDWKTWIVPETAHEMNFLIDPHGFKVHLSKNVAGLASSAIAPSFWEIIQTPASQRALRPGLTPQDVDWALHPGGMAILKNAEKTVEITEEQLRASYDVYENKGNSSSVAVLATLDRLREMGPGRDEVIACSFGPGMTVEMATMKRVRPSKK